MNTPPLAPLVLAMTGASGAPYAVRLLEALVAAGRRVHLVISPSGCTVLHQELGLRVDVNRFALEQLALDPRRCDSQRHRPLVSHLAADRPSPLLAAAPGQVAYHHYQDFMAPIASGSFLTAGMVVCPCSGTTLGGIAHSIGENLIHRAADVHLKERRPLVLVPRETPLSVIQLDNMRRVAEAGGVVLPAMPGWYHQVRTPADLVDFVVARVLDQLQVPNALMRRWGTEEAADG